MKNIHVIPTDKPSRLYKNNVLNTFVLSSEYLEDTAYLSNHHIYITSDDKIIDGDWCMDINGKVFKHKSHFPISIGQRKIILTTDQDLIEDGVQAIDDDFLEWFIKNPKCERVEVVKEQVNNKYGSSYAATTIYKYKIIIPKESFSKMKDEYKSISKAFEDYLQNTSKEEIDRLAKPISDLPNKGVTYEEYINLVTNTHQHIEETLEEAAKYYAHNYFDMHDTNHYKALKQGFEAGAKWQAERMYNEEDMQNYATFYGTYQGDANKYWGKNLFEEWAKQFKK